jgi:hypothetical protein
LLKWVPRQRPFDEHAADTHFFLSSSSVLPKVTFPAQAGCHGEKIFQRDAAPAVVHILHPRDIEIGQEVSNPALKSPRVMATPKIMDVTVLLIDYIVRRSAP